MKSDRFTNVRIPSVKKTTSIVSKKDKGTPERGAPRPARPDRGGGHRGNARRDHRSGSRRERRVDSCLSHIRRRVSLAAAVRQHAEQYVLVVRSLSYAKQ